MKNARRAAAAGHKTRPPNAAADHQLVGAQLWTADVAMSEFF